ncbi:hypothetical protein MKW92_009906, partial [Papaver armeniacum]
EDQIDNNFEDSGLSRLNTVNWEDKRYRRSVMASLVKGVYVLMDDRRRHQQGTEALAPPWWESFDFTLVRSIMNDKDYSIIAAVFEYKPKSNYYDRIIGVFSSKTKIIPGAPKYVIAFRGTAMNHNTVIADMKSNMSVVMNKLQKKPRFKNAMQAVENMVSENGASNIWLAGHSLGSAMAMLVGKNMAKRGNFLESYLFNPPFVAAPIEFIKSRRVRRGILLGCSLITGLLTTVLQDDQERKQSEVLFTTLSQWVPNLFLHPDDIICSGYIAYFEQREVLESWELGNIGRLATQHSWQGLFMNAIGKEHWSEELQLIPSACVTTGSCNIKPHRLSQWFTDDSVSDPKEYRYKTGKAPIPIMT